MRRGRLVVAAVAALLLVAPLPSSAVPSSAVPTGVPVAAAPASWEIGGSGFGHGVGMSQYGAKRLADQGRGAREILRYYYAGTTYDAVPDTQRIGVALEQGAGSVVITGRATSAGGGTVTLRSGSRTVTAPGGAPVTVTRTGTSVRASCSSCGWAPLTGTRMTADVWEARTDLQVAGATYRFGQLVLTPSRTSGLHAVLWMRLHDEYLDQIREMPWSWPSAALEAQAAAARAYALRKVSAGVRDACACHVTDTVSDQVFHALPTGDELAAWPRWRAAVRATGSASTGYVPRYRGAIIEALYSSSHGGWSLDSEDVFGSSLPYLRSRDDSPSLASGNPYRTWTRTVSAGTLARAFGLPDVVRLDLSSRVTGHAVRTAVATSSDGRTARLSGTQLRRALGLPSAFVRRAEARTSGSSPSALAAAVARRSNPVSASSVVLASSYEKDALHALVAQPLAGTLKAPLLLTGRRSLTSATTAELDRRGGAVRRAYVVGGPATVEDRVLRALRARGLTVVRLGGDSIDSVAAAVLDEITSRRSVSAVAVTRNPARSVAATFSGPARRLREPVVVAGATQVPWRTKGAIRRAKVTRAHLLGSSTHVPDAVASSLRSAGVTPVRLTGDDEAAVAGSVGRYFARSVGSAEVVLVPAGSSRVLHRAVAGGLGRVVLVGGAPLPAPTQETLQTVPSWTKVRAVGSTATVPSQALWLAREA